jgi:hypothetical protein
LFFCSGLPPALSEGADPYVYPESIALAMGLRKNVAIIAPVDEKLAKTENKLKHIAPTGRVHLGRRGY